MWPLSVGTDLDNMLILSFVEQTRVLSLIGEEVMLCYKICFIVLNLQACQPEKI